MPEKEDSLDPLSIISKKSNSIVSAKAENPIPTSSLNKIKKFNLFDDEEEIPKKDKTEELFKLPVKRNTKIISFLDDDEPDDPLADLNKNKKIATKEEKVSLFITN